MWHHRAEITYNYADNKEDPDDDRRDFLLCETTFETPLYEIKTARTFTQTMQMLIYLYKPKAQKKSGLNTFSCSTRSDLAEMERY
jgi:hypothetical protein